MLSTSKTETLDLVQFARTYNERMAELERLRAEVKELRRGPAGTIAEAIDLIRDQARDSEGVIDTVRRLIEGQSEPAPLTPERAAILDDAAEATARMVAAIEAQAREGETPDQTVERLIRERDGLRKNFDGAIADLRETEREREQLRADVETLAHKLEAADGDLRRAEHDLARLIRFARGVWTMPELKKFVDEIEERGDPGWLERALSDETAEPVRQERETWKARVSEAVQEGERRIDAVDRELAYANKALAAIAVVVGVEAGSDPRETVAAVRALLAAIQTAIPAIRAGINALGSSEVDVRQRNAARDSLHALEAAVEGDEPPAAVLSAAPICDSCGTDDHPEHGCAGSAYGKPECLASEGKEG